jgi:regulator of protease activity HflC (stomatin/prohibitin superfamily)
MKSEMKQPERLAFAAAAVGLMLAGLAGGLASAAKSAMLAPAVVSAGVLAVLSLMGGWRLRLARRQEEEGAAVAEFRRKHTGGELFENADEAVKLAARARRTYERFVLPALAVLAGAGLAVGGWLLLGAWEKPAVGAVELVAPLKNAVLAFGLFIGCMLAGSYCSGASREASGRWLRPCGAWLYFTGLLLAAAGAGLLLVYWQTGRAEHPADWVAKLDLRLAKVLTGVLMALGVEMVANVVFEFYRPRGAHEEDRPLFESKILALLTEPGGLAANVASALDYQFGFRVSEGWFYRFLERTLLPFALFAGAALWLMTCIVVVQPDEAGLRIRSGHVVDRTPVPPGLHLKRPWPLETISTFPVDKIQTLDIGFEVGDGKTEPVLDKSLRGDLTGRVIVWGRAHHKSETNFLVAGDADAAAAGITAGGRGPVTLNLMSAAIPVSFKVKDLYAYKFAQGDARKVLEDAATREVVRYLANMDLRRILTTDREAGGRELRRRIQASADGLGLGVEIVFVGLQGIHPPVRVGKAYDGVVGALEEKQETLLRAEKNAVTAKLAAEAEALALVSQARGYRQERTTVAEAEASRFGKQLLAYRASPELFMLYSYLDVLETGTRDTRKYIIAAEGHEVIQVDLQKKLRPDLLDVEIPAKDPAPGK